MASSRASSLLQVVCGSQQGRTTLIHCRSELARDIEVQAAPTSLTPPYPEHKTAFIGVSDGLIASKLTPTGCVWLAAGRTTLIHCRSELARDIDRSGSTHLPDAPISRIQNRIHPPPDPRFKVLEYNARHRDFAQKRCVMQPFAIAPSILSPDFARLGQEVDNVLAAGADIVHFDVMDNHYVPNLTIGPMVCAALRKYGIKAPIDVHLMVSPVDRIIGDFIEAGATYITFHPEATQHIDRSLQLIREVGCKAGLVFNPATPLNLLEYVMDKVDMILLMSVNPGFGGQKFIPGTLNKLREARALIDASGRDIRLEIDGGVNVNNIREIAAAGADTFVAGSAIFNAPDYQQVIEKMRAELALAR